MSAPDPGSAAAQVSLVCTYERYTRQERLAKLFPEVECIWREADVRHEQMLRAALLCGFKPAWDHAHLTCLQWAERRVRLLNITMPNHVAEYRRAA